MRDVRVRVSERTICIHCEPQRIEYMQTKTMCQTEFEAEAAEAQYLLHQFGHRTVRI